MAGKYESRFDPALADFSVRLAAVSRPERTGTPTASSADAFFGEDAPAESALPPKAEAATESDGGEERQKLEQVNADLSRIGYPPSEVARILAGTWESPARPMKASVPTGGSEGVAIVGAVGKVIQRFRRKEAT